MLNFFVRTNIFIMQADKIQLTEAVKRCYDVMQELTVLMEQVKVIPPPPSYIETPLPVPDVHRPQKKVPLKLDSGKLVLVEGENGEVRLQPATNFVVNNGLQRLLRASENERPDKKNKMRGCLCRHKDGCTWNGDCNFLHERPKQQL